MTEEKTVEYEKVPVAGFTKASLLPKAGLTIIGQYEGYNIGGKYDTVTHYLISETPDIKIEKTDAAGEREQAKSLAGDKIGISGSKKLNAGLADVARGSKVSINFTGWKEFKTLKGETGREALFSVEVLEAPEVDMEEVPSVFAS